MLEPKSRSTSDVATTRRSYLSPVQGALVAMALIGLSLGLWWVGTRDGGPAEGAQSLTPSPTQTTLSETAAIEIFERLRDARNAAYKHRDISLVNEIYASNSEVHRLAEEQIDRLIRDRVMDQSRYQTTDIEILNVTQSQIVIREESEITPRFVSETGADVSTSPDKRAVQTSRWTLSRRAEEWLIKDILVTRLETT